MNKKTRIIAILIALLQLFSLSSCTKAKESHKNNCKIGIIETNNINQLSKIHFLNDSLNWVSDYSIHHAALGSVSTYPQNMSGKIYMLPLGIISALTKGDTCVLALNPKEKSVETFDMKQESILGFHCSNGCIYSVNARNDDSMVSVISRYDTSNGMLISKKYIGPVIGRVYCSENHLFATGMWYNENGTIHSALYELNPRSLEIENEYDISKFGTAFSDFLLVGNKLFFSPQFTISIEDNSEEIPADYLLIFDIEEKSIRKVQAPVKSLNQIKQLNSDNLLISEYNLALDTGNHVVIFNINSERFDVFELSEVNRQIEIDGGLLYSLGVNTFCVYDINNNFKELDSFDLDLYQENRNHVSSFFIVK